MVAGIERFFPIWIGNCRSIVQSSWYEVPSGSWALLVLFSECAVRFYQRPGKLWLAVRNSVLTLIASGSRFDFVRGRRAQSCLPINLIA